MRVVVTGANRGIGLALVRQYLGRSDRVHATAREPAQAAALEALEIEAAGKLEVHALDVTLDRSCQALGQALSNLPIDLLVNNAGIGGRYVSLAEVDMADALKVYNTNALGALRVTRALVPSLSAARGKIVHVGSLMGSIGDNRSGRAYAYRMSKAALNMASLNLALELRGAGISSVVIHPGWVQTDMGGPSAPTQVDLAARQIVALADRIGLGDSGKFLAAADGRELPW